MLTITQRRIIFGIILIVCSQSVVHAEECDPKIAVSEQVTGIGVESTERDATRDEIKNRRCSFNAEGIKRITTRVRTEAVANARAQCGVLCIAWQMPIQFGGAGLTLFSCGLENSLAIECKGTEANNEPVQINGRWKCRLQEFCKVEAACRGTVPDECNESEGGAG